MQRYKPESQHNQRRAKDKRHFLYRVQCCCVAHTHKCEELTTQSSRGQRRGTNFVTPSSPKTQKALTACFAEKKQKPLFVVGSRTELGRLHILFAQTCSESRRDYERSSERTSFQNHIAAHPWPCDGNVAPHLDEFMCEAKPS